MIGLIKEILSTVILAVIAYWLLTFMGIMKPFNFNNENKEGFVDGIYMYFADKPEANNTRPTAGPANFGSNPLRVDDNYEREFDQAAIEYQGFLPYKNEPIQNGGKWGSFTGLTTDPQYRSDFSSPKWKSAGLEHALTLPNGYFLPRGITDERMGMEDDRHPESI